MENETQEERRRREVREMLDQILVPPNQQKLASKKITPGERKEIKTARDTKIKRTESASKPSMFSKFFGLMSSNAKPTPPEVKKVLAWLVVLRDEFNCRGYSLVEKILSDAVLHEPSQAVAMIAEEGSPKEFVYDRIASIALDQIESGQYHIYRGVLDPMGIGKDLVSIFNRVVEEMVRLGSIDRAKANELLRMMQDGVRFSG